MVETFGTRFSGDRAMLMFSLLLSVLNPSAPAQAAPTPADVRAAVQRSLPVIERTAGEWMHDRNCNSCHVVTFLTWSHNAAAARGLNVDRTKLAEWERWSL